MAASLSARKVCQLDFHSPCRLQYSYACAMDEKQNHITQNLIAPISNYYEILRKNKIAIK